MDCKSRPPSGRQTTQSNMQPALKMDVQRIIAIILQDKAPTGISIQELFQNMHPMRNKNVEKLIRQFPNTFEIYMDNRNTKFVKLISRLTLCEAHCSGHQQCDGDCGSLHICKFYAMSGPKSCRFGGGGCQFGHDYTTSHNQQVLRNNYLDRVSAIDLQFFLKQSDNRTSVTVPRICKFYNVKAGCRADQSDRACPNLHICRHYVIGDCTFGRSCKRSHQVDIGVKSILEKHGFNTSRTPKEILSELRESIQTGEDAPGVLQRCSSQPMLSRLSSLSVAPPLTDDDINSSSGESTASLPASQRNHRRRRRGGRGAQDAGGTQSESEPNPQQGAKKLISKQMSTTDKTGNPVICLYNLSSRCGFGSACFNHHFTLPYQWLYKRTCDTEWIPLPSKDNTEIQLTYSDPINADHIFACSDGTMIQVQFKTMTGYDQHKKNTYDIKHLSTISSRLNEQSALATKWIWSWTTQTGQWKEYGERDGGYKSGIQSCDIEQEYSDNPNGMMSFATQGHEYNLDFTKMVQRNLNYKTEREVRRRPDFVTMDQIQAVKNKQLSTKRVLSPGGATGGVARDVPGVSAPQHWRMDTNQDILDHCQKLQISSRLPQTKLEYKKIEKLFCDTLPSTVSITSIERIENGDLWLNFANKKLKMEKKIKGSPVDERQLFHGTSSQYVDAICRQGFDFRLSGQSSGTRYGKGSYFATTSKYSDSYTDLGSNERIMFVVRVLVGDYTLGNSKYVRPPCKDTKNPCSDLYDSCVDNVATPSIFVVFENGQVYPEYVIKYEMKY